MKCDLHIHTTCSDGTLTPEQVVDCEISNGLKCIAVSDHDTISGIDRAVARAEDKMQVLPAMEISTCDGNSDVHILAYGIAYKDGDFLAELQRVADFRNERNDVLARKLLAAGIDVDYDEMKKSKDGSLGRPDFANKMVQMGVVGSFNQAFDEYLGSNGKCFVRTERLTPVEAIKFTLRFGGIPVLAHPKTLHLDRRKFDAYLGKLVQSGLCGIEAEYFAHTVVERGFYVGEARKHDLLVTGGSDFHSEFHGSPLGKWFSPSAWTKKVLGIKN